MAKTIVPIGPYHPLQEEPEFFTLTVEGERVVAVEAAVGYNHRGVEKLSEMKTFDQSTFVIERICGICSTSHPFAYTQAIEDICLSSTLPFFCIRKNISGTVHEPSYISMAMPRGIILGILS